MITKDEAITILSNIAIATTLKEHGLENESNSILKHTCSYMTAKYGITMQELEARTEYIMGIDDND